MDTAHLIFALWWTAFTAIVRGASDRLGLGHPAGTEGSIFIPNRYDYLFGPAEGSRHQPKLTEPGGRQFIFLRNVQQDRVKGTQAHSRAKSPLSDFGDKAWTGPAVEPSPIRESLSLEQKVEQRKKKLCVSLFSETAVSDSELNVPGIQLATEWEQ
ncbi:hypothetical protein DFH06DRAFT_1149466 [Mycena polygramma]|nr:hypothetical protein DFH06DRAFT_1149466 [Mycena polygramma]